MAGADGENTQSSRHAASPPARLALQTGRLDDHRSCITSDDAFWQAACLRFARRDDIHDERLDDGRDAELETLCMIWPPRGDPGRVEALAVTVDLAAPFAGRDRILAALSTPSVPVDALERELAVAPALASPWSPPRPRFPYIYDPDSEDRAPIIAMLDGPRCPQVAIFMNTMKEHDENLAAAIVLGADVDLLDLLDDVSLTATRASRPALAGTFEHDKLHWMQRAEGERVRQRLEGKHYGWRSDNVPPGCLEAAKGEIEHLVHAVLQQQDTRST